MKRLVMLTVFALSLTFASNEPVEKPFLEIQNSRIF